VKCIVFFCVLLGGCASAELNVPKLQLAFNPFDTQVNRPDVLLTGGIAGRLHVEGSCVQLRTRSEKLTPLWPGETTISNANGRLEIVLPDGRGRGAIGQRVKLSGSSFPTDESAKLAKMLPKGCSSNLFAVSRIE
jgi:hypothetical protein